MMYWVMTKKEAAVARSLWKDASFAFRYAYYPREFPFVAQVRTVSTPHDEEQYEFYWAPVE